MLEVLEVAVLKRVVTQVIVLVEELERAKVSQIAMTSTKRPSSLLIMNHLRRTLTLSA